MLLERLNEIHKLLSDSKIDHALIGGLALGAHGVQRFTNDIDLLIEESNIDHTLEILESEGHTVFHRTAEVLQLKGKIPIDILIARRPISIQILEEAKPITPLKIKCVSVEGLIGLKVQAYKNNPKRELGDKSDIQKLIEHNSINWKKLKTIVDLFDEWDEIQRIKRVALA